MTANFFYLKTENEKKTFDLDNNTDNQFTGLQMRIQAQKEKQNINNTYMFFV